MAYTLITPSFTTLYRQTEIDPLNLHNTIGDYSDTIDLDMVQRAQSIRLEAQKETNEQSTL